MAFSIESPAFQNGGPIPRRYTGDGDNVSPGLSWSAPPGGTRAMALIVEDPDAPGTFPFVHWVVYRIPPALGGLPEGALPEGVVQGRNSYQNVRYDGPAPPPGPPHHYRFRLFALDHDLELAPGLDSRGLQVAMEGHALAEVVLIGTYQRER
jgi:Raf kinase inhibitor-like YbhB/YbcL family protein